MDDDEFDDIMDEFFGSADGVAQSEGSLYIPQFDVKGQLVEEQEIPFQGGFRNSDLSSVHFSQVNGKVLSLQKPIYDLHICPHCNTKMTTEKKIIKAIFEEVLNTSKNKGVKNMTSPRVNHKDNKPQEDPKAGIEITNEESVSGIDAESMQNAVATFMVGLSATLDSFETRYSLGDVLGEDNELITQFFTLTVDIQNMLLFIAFNNSELNADDSMFIADVCITITKYCFRSGWSLKLVESYYTEDSEEDPL